MTLPLTELLLGLDLAAMVVFGMLLRRKKGLRAAVICLCTALPWRSRSISQICCWMTSGQSAGVLSRKFNNKAARPVMVYNRRAAFLYKENHRHGRWL